MMAGLEETGLSWGEVKVTANRILFGRIVVAFCPIRDEED